MSNGLRQSALITMLDAAAPRAITSSTNASPIVVTTAAHGYSTGDVVTISGHATNTAANGTWVITVTAATTYQLTKNLKSGVISTGNGVGGGTGVHAKGGSWINVADYQHVILAVDTDGGGDAAFTVKVAGSISDTPPDFIQAQLPANQYDYLSLIDIENNTNNIAGATGFIVASADDHRIFEVNTNGITWVGAVPTAGTAGEITIKMRGYTNE